MSSFRLENVIFFITAIAIGIGLYSTSSQSRFAQTLSTPTVATTTQTSTEPPVPAATITQQQGPLIPTNTASGAVTPKPIIRGNDDTLEREERSDN
jgi:hypothetical protein